MVLASNVILAERQRDVPDEMQEKPFIAIVGCGQTGSILIRFLIESWYLLLIDKNEKIIRQIKERYPSDQVNAHAGDATSYSFLNKVQIRKAYQILITVGSDETTNELIHILQKRMSFYNIIAQVMDATLAEKLKKKGITVVYPPETSANFMLNQMPIGQSIAAFVGKGEGEIMQIQITRSSPLANKPLKELPPTQWIIGAIYRARKQFSLRRQPVYMDRLQISKDDDLIIPRGDTRPRVGDKLLLIGDPKILKATAYYLKAGSPVFPTRHGETVISMFFSKDEDGYQEFDWLLSKMEPSDMCFFYNNKVSKKFVNEISFPADWIKKAKDHKTHYFTSVFKAIHLVSQIAVKQRIGLIIYKKPKNRIISLFHRFFLLPSIIKKIRELDTPLWILKDQKKINNIFLFVYTDEGTLRAAELAIDTALKLNLEIRAIQVNPPYIIAGESQTVKNKSMMRSVREICALYGVNIQEVIREGNPVIETLRQVREDDLLVISIPKENQEKFLIPNSAELIFKKFKGSMLVLAT